MSSRALLAAAASWLFYACAFAATGVMVTSSADQSIRVGVQRHLVVSGYGQAAVISGYALPVLVAPGIYVTAITTGAPTW